MDRFPAGAALPWMTKPKKPLDYSWSVCDQKKRRIVMKFPFFLAG